jgi:hypothetical protein
LFPVKLYILLALTQEQAGDYETKGIIKSHATFCLSSKTKDLDEKFTQVLSSMGLDTAGGLVEILSRQGKMPQPSVLGMSQLIYTLLEFLQLVIAPWKDFALDWVARCAADGEGEYVSLPEFSSHLSWSRRSGLASLQQGVRSAGQTHKYIVGAFYDSSGRVGGIGSASGNTDGWGKIFEVS